MAELVSKTSSAVAVTEDLTTLLDWVNIETLSGFTLVVTNAGGGSANDITDVQIDTSDDGGVTSDLDQHAGVPAVPIADGESKEDSFTDSSAYLRVRALCAAGQDTTATAILLADASTGRLCTLTDVKDRLGIRAADTDYDQLINRLIASMTARFEKYCHGRRFILNAADETEYFTGCGRYLQLDRYPIVSITSIKQAYDYDFTSATALTEDTDFRIVKKGKAGNKGIIYKINSAWLEKEDIIQVVYKGGFCPAGQTPGAGEFALADDLREAAIVQSAFDYKRKDDLGLASISAEGGSISKFETYGLLKAVRVILDSYKKALS